MRTSERKHEPWFEDLRDEFNHALPAIIAGAHDRTDLMRSTERARERLPRVREIISAVAHASGLEFMALIGQSVNRELANSRALAICLACEMRPDLSHVQIAEALNKDRSLVKKALRRAEDLKMNDNDFVHWYANARRRLGYA